MPMAPQLHADRHPALAGLYTGFARPPAGYGIVPFFWWLGDPLTRERLSWILGQMDGMPISGYQINYAHGYRDGGIAWGLTIPSEPKLFSEAWWELFAWFLGETTRRGATLSLSDYTLGIGQGWAVDRLIAEHPELRGATLALVEGRCAEALAVIEGTPPRSVIVVPAPMSFDPMHPDSGRLYAEAFFGQFERRFPGQCPDGLNWFFSDELVFGVAGRLWNNVFRDEFRRRKGYDLLPELPALFLDTGPRAPKVRLDYQDVLVSLSEEGFFKPVFDWHEQRGMTLGCDHGGRGYDVTEFGDYFRTQRWNQGPGADQPGLTPDVVKAKVAASIAHLYQRPRVWLEGFYSSGWGTSPADLVKVTSACFVMGYDLLSLHGMYYATHGGWWEWAPPDNTFRMPYWRHLQAFLRGIERLSWLLSRGMHRCDVAILYPVAAVEAGLDGKLAVDTAVDAMRTLYGAGLDADFMDFQSVERAEVADGELRIAGERYRVLVIPAMRAIRHSTLAAIIRFRRAGGAVVVLGVLPEASDRIGLGDPEVAALAAELAPATPAAEVLAAVSTHLPVRDYLGPGIVQHRVIGVADLYAVHGAAAGAEAVFRAVGAVELWHPQTGERQPWPVLGQDAATTRLRLPDCTHGVAVLVFTPGGALTLLPEHAPTRAVAIPGPWRFELRPTCDNRYGDFHWPPTPAMLGAEMRRPHYCPGECSDGDWTTATVTFGPMFLACRTRPHDRPVPPADAQPIAASLRWGIEDDPGLQGYHGLKNVVHDDLFAFGSRSANWSWYDYQPDAERPFLWTTVHAPQEMEAYVLRGAIAPRAAWINGKPLIGASVRLQAGANVVVLEYDRATPGRTWFLLSSEPAANHPPRPADDLATRWWQDTRLLPYDVRPHEAQPAGWYRFTAPPGLRALELEAHGTVQLFAGDKALTSADGRIWRVAEPAPDPVEVRMHIQHQRGRYAGAAFDGPIRLDCGEGRLGLGDWSELDGLACYSGGAWYRHEVELPAADGAMLELGEVAGSAEVLVNGQAAGVLVAPPWRLPIGHLLKAGRNRIEVLVCNTLANHYQTIPTRYRGSPRSGLIGPVRVLLEWS
jgi:hypothetical protein